MNVSQVTNDILNNPRFEGAISSIDWLTQYTDVAFAMAITFVAFLIILVAMFKNVLAAAYCAYPKFWDDVHRAHETKQGTNFIKQTMEMVGHRGAGFVDGSANGQTAGQIILGILPDIKHMTDFESDTISAKHYFMKAIPQMLVCVCLGAFIYNGTYRDVAGLVVDTGTTLVNRTLLEWDPIAMYDSFTGSAGRPVFRSDNAIDQFTQNQNVVATGLYTAIIGTYVDITSADQKRALADNCDDEAQTILQIVDSMGWNVQASAGGEFEAFEMTSRMNWASTDMTSQLDQMIGQVSVNPRVYQYAYCTSLEAIGISGVSSEVHPANTYIVTIMQFKEVNVDVSGAGWSDAEMGINSSGTALTIKVGAASGNVYFETPKVSTNFTNDSGEVAGTLDYSSSGGTYELKIGENPGGPGTYKLATPLRLVVKASSGTKTIVITKINVGGTPGQVSYNGSSFSITDSAEDIVAKLDVSKGGTGDTGGGNPSAPPAGGDE